MKNMKKLIIILIILMFVPSCKTKKETIIQEQELSGLFSDTTFYDETFEGNESNMILSKINNLIYESYNYFSLVQ